MSALFQALFGCTSSGDTPPLIDQIPYFDSPPPGWENSAQLEAVSVADDAWCTHHTSILISPYGHHTSEPEYGPLLLTSTGRLDVTTGVVQEWSNELPGLIFMWRAGDHIVGWGSEGNAFWLFGFEPDGSVRWRVSLGDEYLSELWGTPSCGDVVFTGDGAYDAGTGELRWAWPTELLGWVHGGFPVADGAVFAWGRDPAGYISRIDCATGVVDWEIEAIGVDALYALGGDDPVLNAADDTTVTQRIFGARDGIERFSVPSRAPFVSAGAGRLYGAAGDIAVDAMNGDTVWVGGVDEFQMYYSTYYDGQSIGGVGRGLGARDAATGVPLWWAPYANPGYCAPIVYGKWILLSGGGGNGLGDGVGTLYAIDLDDLP